MAQAGSPRAFAESAATERGTRLIWGLVAAFAAVTAAAYRMSGLGLDLASGTLLYAVFAVLGLAALVYRVLRPDPWLGHAALAAVQLLALAMLATLLTFPAAALGARFACRDATLAGMDAALGLDWLAYLAFVDGLPGTPRLAFHLAYSALQPQLALVVAVLIAANRPARLQEFTVAFAAGLALSVGSFVAVPAVAHYEYLGLGPADFSGILPTALAGPFSDLLHALRAGTLGQVRLDQLDGLITFPSFHTVAAVLFAWAAWPLPRLRWFTLALNLSMIATTPIEGAHYFVDILAGVAVAAVSLVLARLLCRGRIPAQQPELSSMPAWPRPRTAPR